MLPIPLAHEDLRGRRWPYITMAIILLNIAILAVTDGPIEQDAIRIARLRLHILLLATRHPDAQMPPAATEIVEAVKKEDPISYKRLTDPNRSPVDTWEANQFMREGEASLADINHDLEDLCDTLAKEQESSLLWKYAYHSAHPTLVSYVTADFLHFGWLHLIFNMWFLWLAGTVLEDAWGRIAYPIFYLMAGVAALVTHGVMFPASYVPVAGASGAVAGMMGAFLARFPKTKIRMLLIVLFRPFVFSVPAYFILPLWLLSELFYGMMADDGVAHWAHIGGFAFGVGGAILLRLTGVEQAIDKKIEAKVTWTADPHFVRASELIDQNQPDDAMAELQILLGGNLPPAESIDAYELYLKAQQRKQDYVGMRDTLTKLCQLALRTGDPELAWRFYEQFIHSGGNKFPPAAWLDLCRQLEKEQAWDRAAGEYERLAMAHANERASLTALIAAARIWQTKLNRRDEAARLYRAAENSPVPHLDIEGIIQQGLKQCEGPPQARAAGAGSSK